MPPNDTDTVTDEMDCFCPCSMVIKPNNKTDEERERDLVEKLKQIKLELYIPREELSSVLRKKVSVPDERASAMGIGLLGIALVVGVFGAVFLLDLSAIARDMRMFKENLSYFFERN